MHPLTAFGNMLQRHSHSGSGVKTRSNMPLCRAAGGQSRPLGRFARRLDIAIKISCRFKVQDFNTIVRLCDNLRVLKIHISSKHAQSENIISAATPGCTISLRHFDCNWALGSGHRLQNTISRKLSKFAMLEVLDLNRTILGVLFASRIPPTFTRVHTVRIDDNNWTRTLMNLINYEFPALRNLIVAVSSTAWGPLQFLERVGPQLLRLELVCSNIKKPPGIFRCVGASSPLRHLIISAAIPSPPNMPTLPDLMKITMTDPDSVYHFSMGTSQRRKLCEWVLLISRADLPALKLVQVLGPEWCLPNRGPWPPSSAIEWKECTDNLKSKGIRFEDNFGTSLFENVD
jgi:hypothetical protein